MKVHNTAKEKNPVSLSKLIECILHFLYCCTASRESSKAKYASSSLDANGENINSSLDLCALYAHKVVYVHKHV